MSVARITTLNFKSKEGADQIEETYKVKAPSEFPEAEQLLEVRVDDTTLMFVSLYVDNDAMERASAARTNRMDLNKDLIDSMDGMKSKKSTLDVLNSLPTVYLVW